MILRTNIRQGNIGVIASVPAWLFDYQLQLTTEEAELVRIYRVGGRPLCSYPTDSKVERFITVAEAVTGVNGRSFKELIDLYRTRDDLLTGCSALRDYLLRIFEIRAGGGAQTIEIPLHTRANSGAAPPPLHTTGTI